jgi:hypothetical protein
LAVAKSGWPEIGLRYGVPKFNATNIALWFVTICLEAESRGSLADGRTGEFLTVLHFDPVQEKTMTLSSIAQKTLKSEVPDVEG